MMWLFNLIDRWLYRKDIVDVTPMQRVLALSLQRKGWRERI